MNLWKISIQNFKSKPLYSFLSILLLALSIALLLGIQQLKSSFQYQMENNLANVDAVIGAKGSPLQLVLSSVLHIDNPTGNISYKEAKKIAKNRLVKSAIPISYGDNYKGYRIVGTTPDFLPLYGAELKQGHAVDHSMEVVLGSAVAKQLHLHLGDTFRSSHGLIDNDVDVHEQEFTVVGILKPTQKVIDRLIVCNLESIWQVHDHEDHEHDESHTDKEPEHDEHQHKHAEDEHNKQHELGIPHSHQESHKHEEPKNDEHQHKHAEDEHNKQHALGIPHSHQESHTHEEPKNDEHQHKHAEEEHNKQHALGIPHSHQESHTHDETEHDDHQHKHTDEEHEEHTHVQAEEDDHHHTYNEDEQEITSLLLSFRSPTAFLTFPRRINEKTNFQAALPKYELDKLYQFTGVGFKTISWIAYIILIISGLTIFISMFKMIKERAFDLALLRT